MMQDDALMEQQSLGKGQKAGSRQSSVSRLRASSCSSKTSSISALTTGVNGDELQSIGQPDQCHLLARLQAEALPNFCGKRHPHLTVVSVKGRWGHNTHLFTVVAALAGRHKCKLPQRPCR